MSGYVEVGVEQLLWQNPLICNACALALRIWCAAGVVRELFLDVCNSLHFVDARNRDLAGCRDEKILVFP